MNGLLGLNQINSVTILGYGLDIAAKVTVVIFMIAGLQGVLGRRRVLISSVLWNAGLVGLLVLPIATLALPRFPIHWLPALPIGERVAPPSHSNVDQQSAASPIPSGLVSGSQESW
jgi:hypothetical protein